MLYRSGIRCVLIYRVHAIMRIHGSKNIWIRVLYRLWLADARMRLNSIGRYHRLRPWVTNLWLVTHFRLMMKCRIQFAGPPRSVLPRYELVCPYASVRSLSMW